MMAAVIWGQEELFPVASRSEILKAKSLLMRYRRMKLIVDDFERKGEINLNAKQKIINQAFKQDLDRIERSVSLIMDDEIKRIVELRFIKGERHKTTVLYFRSMMHATTVDRKINKGIESVANTLKLWEE